MRDKRLGQAIGIGLVISTAIVFGRALGYGFISYDDAEYVTANPLVRGGLSWQAVIRAFTSSHFANWHALTWISHMVDVQIWGMNAGGHHLSSILLHILNVVILFALLRRLTGSVGRSGFVAALFAIHPMHVEPVVWIASRKDVLSTLFALLTIWAYAKYVESAKISWYFLVVVFFAMGLLAKPMLVTLPFVLLLLDYWPLCRLSVSGAPVLSPQSKIKHCTMWKLLAEKTPLFAISVMSSLLTYSVQRHDQALRSLDAIPAGIRLSNAVVSYVSYIGRMVWPRNLSIFYPHPMDSLPEWKVFGAILVLTGVTLYTIYVAKRRPYFPVGWFWYLGSLVPVIGIIQFGSHSMADRYTYVSFLGLFILVAWGIPELLCGKRGDDGSPGGASALPFVSLISVSALAVAAWAYVGCWKNSYDLFAHALAATHNNVVAHCSFADELKLRGRLPEATAHYQRALEINPFDSIALNNLGVALAESGKRENAKRLFYRAIKINPMDAEAHNNIGVALAAEGRLGDAITHYFKALKSAPGHAMAHYNLGVALMAQAKIDEGIKHLAYAARLSPDDARIHYDLALALAQKGDLDAAIREFQTTVRLQPGNAGPYYNLGVAFAAQHRFREAVEAYRRSIRLDPRNPSAHKNLAVALFELGEYTDAWKEVELCRKYGGRVHPEFLRMLSKRMPR